MRNGARSNRQDSTFASTGQSPLRILHQAMTGGTLKAPYIDIETLKRDTVYIIREFRSVSHHGNGVLRLAS